MKKKLAVLAMVGILVGVFAVGNALAAPQWYVCSISEAGATTFGVSFVTLTDTAATPAFTNVVFFIYDTTVNSNKMYAAALTALANSSNVRVYMDGVAEGTPVNGLLVEK